MTLTASRRRRSARATPADQRRATRGRLTTPAVAQALEGRLLMAADFRISEFMASNVSTLPDEDGQYNDWIEIRNTGDAAGNLAGYRLTDNAAQLSQWTFPSVSLPAGGQLVVFASGKNRTDPAGPHLHTNFSLNADGEYLALVAPDGTKKSEFAPRFPGQEADVSYGTDYAAPGQPLRYFATPTPGAANTRAEAVINEIHYDPDVKTQLVEFLELTNPGSAPVDLSSAYFSDGITYTFPQGTTLAPGAYIVLAENAAQFQAKFGSAPFGQYTGSLSNDGETVRLKNKSGGTLDMVDYQPGFPWPTVGDAPGYSIELINPDFDNSVGGNWRAQPPAQTAGTTLVPSGSAWKYLKGTAEASNPVSDWRQVTFPDASWSTGNAPIGYDGNSVMGTKLSDMQGGYTSVFMRKTFSVADPSAFNALKLEANFDDGFNVWINGTFAYSQNVSGGQNAAYNGVATTTIEDISFRSFNLPGGLLRAGTNVIAVQFFNSSLANSSDAFFDGRLIASASGASPTPGRRNSVFADNAAPQMRQVNNTPEQPRGGDVVTVTAKITDPDGVASAMLSYQVVTPGNYIAIDDPAYQTDWTAIPMHDDGTSGDAVAGDGIYSAQVPADANQHRNLVRYRVSSTDSRGASITAPYADDSVPNFAYFVYDGIPAWTGAAQPGVTPAVTYSADVMNSVQAFHLISKQSQVEDATWWSKYSGDNYLWKGTLVFNGKVYDHIRYRTRGGSAWRYAMGKNAWKIDFNHNHDLEMTDDYGNPYKEKWGKLSLRANIQQGNFWHRGEQGLFESVGYKLFNLAGTPAERTTFVQLRIIDAPQEATADQYTGDLWGGYLAVEEPDNHFLDEHDLPDGNIYDMEGGTGYLNNQGPTGVTDKSDLNAFLNTYTTTTPTEDWWRANLDLSAYYAYRTILEGIHHYDVDQSAGKNYFYYLNPATQQWMVLPWDLDLTWSDNMYGGGDEPFKSRVLPKPGLNLEYKNAIRNIRDLLFNSDQAGQVIDEMAAKVWTPGQPSFVDVDRAMWDYNPVLDDPNRTYGDKGGTGRFYKGNPAAGVVIPAPGGFAGMIQKMKNYVVTRAGVLDGLASDSAIPAKPTLTYTGAANYPADAVRFHSSNFSDTTGSFAGMQWRLAEVTNPNAPGYDPKAPKKYEINSTWESGELATFTPDMDIPAQYLQAGHTYRVRVRMKDSTGRWSNWSNAAQFIPGLPDQTVKDALRITEINYHPAPNPAGPPAEDEFEFVELQNTSATAINLKDVKFTNGIDYVFGDVTLGAGQYVVIARNRDAFAQRYGAVGINLAPGTFTKALDNDQDHVVLLDATNQTIHDFTYLDAWYPSTDGEGATLVVADVNQPIAAWNTAAGWKASSQPGGSPGAADGADTTAPTADIVDVSPDPRNSPVNSVTIIFSEPVTGFDLSDLTLATAANPATNLLTAAQALNSADGGRTWTLANLTGLTFAPAAQFVLTLKGSGTGITDAAGNPLAGGAVEDWVVDMVGPTATITAVAPDPRNAPVTDLTITFSEPVNGFNLADLTLTRGGGANLLTAAQTLTPQPDGRSYKLENLAGLTAAAGAYALTLNPANSGITDGVGNPINTGATETWTADTSAPTANVTDVTPDPRKTPVNSITIVFSEPVVGFDKSDLTLTRNGGANLIASFHTLDTTDGGRTWVLGGLSNQTGPEGTYLLTVGTGITDAAGNALAAPATDQWVVDFTAPTADVIDLTPDPRNTPVSAVLIVFSEPVTGFDLSDLRLTGVGGVNRFTGAETLGSADGGRTWTLGNLSAATNQTFEAFTLRLVAAGSGITDAAGNALASDAADTFVVDQAGPTAQFQGVVPNPRNTPVDGVLISFSEDVNGFDLADLSLTRDGGPNLLTAAQTLTQQGAGGLYLLEGLTALTAPGGTYRLTLTAAGSGITDLVGNPISADRSTTWVTDTTAPTADIIDVTPDPRDGPVDSITIKFSEPVSGFDLSDLWLTVTDIANVLTDAQTLTTSDNGVTWVLGNLAGVSPTNASYTLTLRAADSNIHDAAGNPLAADASDSWTEGQIIIDPFFDLFVRGSAWSTAFKTYLEQKGLGDDAFGYQLVRPGGPVPGPAENPEQILPWINSDQLVLRYANVPVGSGVPTPQSVVVTSQQGVAYTVLGVVQDPGNPAVFVVTLDKPLGGGNPATGTAPTSQQNGDRITVTVPSGGFGGGNVSTRLNVLQGDVDHTGEAGTHSVLAADFSLVKKKFFTNTTTAPTGSDADYSAFADVDGSGTILANDFSEVKKRFFQMMPAAPASIASTGGIAPLAPSSTTKDLFGSTPILA